MTQQVPDYFEWEGKKLPVCNGCAPPLPHPDVEECATWGTPGSGFVEDDIKVELRQQRYNREAEEENGKRRAAGLPEITPRVAERHVGSSTSCYRGYIARWAVVEERLVLAFIEGNHRLRDGQPVPVPYTGRFILGTGERIPFTFAPEYTHHVYLDFVEGRLQAVTQDEPSAR